MPCAGCGVREVLAATRRTIQLPPLAHLLALLIDRAVWETRLEARATNAGERVRAGRPKASHEPINAARSPGATCAKTSKA